MKTEFEPATENAALKEAIVERIRSQGPLTFRDFMDAALYHPQHGYYRSRREKMGREGDYLTSPEVSPIFGVMLGRQLREMWHAMGKPLRFDVVEAGAGTGRLCRDILRWARSHAPEYRGALSYTIVEVSAAQAERQRETLAEEGCDVRWPGELPEGTEGCLLSNELLDSFPVHRVTVRDGALLELFVGWDGARFVEELHPPSTPALESYFASLGLLPGEGCLAEVNLAALDWVRAAGRALRSGFLLTLDYGYEAAELYAPWRKDGTLLCFHRHNASGDPYARLGRQDITSHVDFTSLRRAGEESGLRTLGLVSQGEFLTDLGIGEAMAPPGEGDVDLEEYYARRRAVSELVDPAALGRIRVMVQAKGMREPGLTGPGGGRNA
ncbi:MAG TPA: SAM-dependent methyltransferase [Dehalococcoidia bacterium]|nr:SAM-dependent methyltransferase [Dehalococcoidia bacterium]